MQELWHASVKVDVFSAHQQSLKVATTFRGLYLESRCPASANTLRSSLSAFLKRAAGTSAADSKLWEVARYNDARNVVIMH